jgi:hypothetical protein
MSGLREVAILRGVSPPPESLRDAVRSGALRGAALRAAIEAVPPAARDPWVERLLGLHGAVPEGRNTEGELIGYLPSGVGAILHLVDACPLRADDVLVDVGAGLGKVLMLAHLLTGARAVGVELDGELVQAAQGLAADLRLEGVSFAQGDARVWLPEGTVYFLYAPLLGGALAQALDRLEEVTRGRAVQVCTLGLDLPARPWLRARESTDFWVGFYERVP